MLGVLCARPKPNWILNSLVTHFHLNHHHHHNSNNRLSLHLSGSSAAARRHHSSLCSADSGGGGAAAIWHVIQPADWRRKTERRSVRGEGSWNAAWDGRPARWLHRPDSAWLLFGVCACLAPAIEFLSDVNNIDDVNHQVKERIDGGDLNASSEDAKQDSSDSAVGSDYKVTGLRNGEEAPDENRQRELADELRAQVVDELLKRREESEWFIEGDFDAYVKRIQQPYVWGGEPELLMASHVLKTMISVFMRDRTTGNLVNIVNYGEEYQKDEVNPINVLFHGYGHYDILETTPGQSCQKVDM
ncbi:OTU-LIKE CYSTEINE PROTEASE [Salix purpurea]|uniref:Ubiquitin thioesterase OTU n=1 Tax=Salix purpurea TaxID=77065 RepID=A0A9Q0Z156_SALPP|nr:OTU-LIKE CYSTEINE PROTEASE [Salix purpurea]